MWLARVHVALKPTVLDPQGQTVRSSLHHLGFEEVRDVRVGKYMEIHLAEDDRAAAEERVDQMCRQLLANPVIESYRFEVTEA